MDDKKKLVEDCLGEFGFRVKWRYSEYWVDVTAYDVSSILEDGTDEGIPLYGSTGAETIEEAKPYLKGYVKWDGCSELDQIGTPHWCGWDGYQKHIDLLTYIYNQAFELMGRPKPEDDNG